MPTASSSASSGRAVGFIGAGAMSSAIIGGLAKTDLFTKYTVVDPSEPAVRHCQSLVSSAGGTFVPSSCVADLVTSAACDVIVLGVKPQVAPMVFPQLRKAIEARGPAHRPVVVSIMAGIKMAALRVALGPQPKLFRTMPNAPLLVGAGASGLSADDAGCTTEDVTLVENMFRSVGYCAIVPEAQLDAVTGVSGSGPAYIAAVIEALADGGVKMGLPRKLALELAAATVAGTGQMAQRGGAKGGPLHPALLKDMVCSPGGTSIYGLAAAENRGLRPALVAAVQATTHRARELGKPSKL